MTRPRIANDASMKNGVVTIPIIVPTHSPNSPGNSRQPIRVPVTATVSVIKMLTPMATCFTRSSLARTIPPAIYRSLPENPIF